MDLGYFRVSKEEESKQDIDSQIEAVQDFFNVKFDYILKERGSAYDLNKIHKRTEFLRLLRELFQNKPIEDIFMGNLRTSKINLYVWDYDRLMRNIRLNTLFITLCDIFDVTIYSYKDGKTIKKDIETPSETFARYMLMSVHAFTGEQYSYTISTNIKKSIKKDKMGTSRSTKEDKKWGRQFSGVNGDKVMLSENEEKSLIKRIKYLIGKFERMKFKGYYDNIIQDIERLKQIKISKSYITKVRKQC